MTDNELTNTEKRMIEYMINGNTDFDYQLLKSDMIISSVVMILSMYSEY